MYTSGDTHTESETSDETWRPDSTRDTERGRQSTHTRGTREPGDGLYTLYIVVQDRVYYKSTVNTTKAFSLHESILSVHYSSMHR